MQFTGSCLLITASKELNYENKSQYIYFSDVTDLHFGDFDKIYVV